MTIDDEVAALRRERPKPDTALTDTLIDLLEAVLSPERALSVPEAAETYLKALDAHIERKVGAYLRTVEIVG